MRRRLAEAALFGVVEAATGGIATWTYLTFLKDEMLRQQAIVLTWIVVIVGGSVILAARMLRTEPEAKAKVTDKKDVAMLSPIPGVGPRVTSLTPVEPPKAPVRIRLASPPDDTGEDVAESEWVHITVTNDGPKPLRATATVYLVQSTRSAQMRWEPDAEQSIVLAPNGKKSQRFLLAIHARRDLAYNSHKHNRGQFVIPAGRAIICDDNFYFSTQGAMIVGGGREQLRIDVDCEDGSVASRRFDMYVPTVKGKSLWVVPRGEYGSD